MVEIGSVLSATVSRVEPYGVYLRHGHDTVLVLAPEASWVSAGDLQARFRVGDTLDVFVLRYNYKSAEIVGSFRRLHPELNPYRQLSRLERGTVLASRVVQSIADDVTVKLENGAWGHVPKRLLHTDVKAGDKIDVVITGIEVDEGRLWLEPAREQTEGSNWPVNSPPAVSKAS